MRKQAGLGFVGCLILLGVIGCGRSVVPPQANLSQIVPEQAPASLSRTSLHGDAYVGTLSQPRSATGRSERHNKGIAPVRPRGKEEGKNSKSAAKSPDSAGSKQAENEKQDSRDQDPLKGSVSFGRDIQNVYRPTNPSNTLTFKPVQTTTTNQGNINLGLNLGVFKGVRMPVGVDAENIPVADTTDDLKQSVVARAETR
jgi:hypothetical protein